MIDVFNLTKFTEHSFTREVFIIFEHFSELPIGNNKILIMIVS